MGLSSYIWVKDISVLTCTCVLQSTAFETSWMTWRGKIRIHTFPMKRTFTCRNRQVAQLDCLHCIFKSETVPNLDLPSVCFLLPPPHLYLAGGGQHAASSRVGDGDEAPENPNGEQQAAAAAGGQCPRAAGQVLHARAQQAEPWEGVHQPAGGARDGEERAQPGLGDHQRPDGWVTRRAWMQD